MVTEQEVLSALATIKDPDLHRDIMSLGFIKDLRIDGAKVSFTIELTTPACPVRDQIVERVRRLREMSPRYAAAVQGQGPKAGRWAGH